MTENKFKTDLPEMMVGFYTAEDVRRRWTEDFVDSDTGTVTSAERSELILERGTYIDADVASSLSFHIQAGDIDGVEVTDIKRSARPFYGNSFSPWKAVAAVTGKPVTLILYAKHLEHATEIAREYIERTREGSFTMQSVQAFKDCIFVEHEFTEEEEFENGTRIERAFYQLDAVISWLKDPDYPEARLFLVLAKDVDEAKALTEDWVADRASRMVRAFIEEAARDGGDADVSKKSGYVRYSGGFDLRILSGTKIPCNATVPLEFSKDYDPDDKKEE